jgi:nucleotide-binding universal stress UspA family protein
MFKNVLVFLDGGEEALRGLELAVTLVQSHGGRVRGLFVKRLGVAEIAAIPPGPEFGAGTPVIFDPELLAILEAQQEQIATQVKEDFFRLAGECSGGLEVIRGDVVEELVNATHTSDLVIMGRGGPEKRLTEGWLSEITLRVLKKSWAPVLLPSTASSIPWSGPYFLAYDGSPAANRVLRQLARLALINNAALTVLAVGSVEVTRERLQEVRAYLTPYGQPFTLEAQEGKAALTILEAVKKQPYSLLALGAHGHSKIRDIFLGTTTDSMLRKLPQAFLICAL